MGRKESKLATDVSTSAANRFNTMSDELYGTSKADTSQARDYYTDIAAGGDAAQRAVAPQAEQVKNQYRLLRERLERFMPRGGALDKANQDATISEFSDVGRLYTDRIEQAIAQLAQLGITGTGQALQAGQGTLGAAEILGKLAGDKAAGTASMVGGIAQGAGTAAVLL